METNLIPFDYHGQAVRTVQIDGEPWFVAKDVCAVLELDPTQTRRLDDDEKGMYLIQTHGGKQDVAVITESGLYSLTLGSKKPEAKPFKRWITHDVIPAIRKTGAYSIRPCDSYMIEDPVERAKAWIQEEQCRQSLVSKIESDKPKVLFADAVESSQTSILIGDMAKILRQNGVQIGQNRLFQFLRDNGFLIGRGERYNTPTQRAMDMGLFELKERIIHDPDGSIRITRTPKVTGKGQTYFVSKFLSAKEAG